MWPHAWYRPRHMAGSVELLRVMPLAQRRVCTLCGRAYASALPRDAAETEHDQLYGECAGVSAPPAS
jgi:hypothetical protein